MREKYRQKIWLSCGTKAIQIQPIYCEVVLADEALLLKIGYIGVAAATLIHFSLLAIFGRHAFIPLLLLPALLHCLSR